MRAQTADRTAAQTADRTTSQTADRTTAQTADRTTAQPVHLLKPDRCTVDIAGPQSQDAQHVVSIGPHGTIRCSVPGLASPRPTATAQHGGHQHDLHQSSRRVSPLRSKQQQGAKHLCPYHQRDTITVSLVNQPDLLTPPSRAVSPHRSQRGHTAQAATSAADAANTKGYVRMVAVGPGYCSPQATASAQCDRLYSSQPREQQQVHIGPRCCPDASAPAQCGKPCIRQPKGHQCQQQCPAEPERCPEPAAASPAGRKAALAQLRMTRRRQQSGVVSKQKVQECMAARQRQGPGQQWSSSRKAAEHSGPLNDLGKQGTALHSTVACRNDTDEHCIVKHPHH